MPQGLRLLAGSGASKHRRPRVRRREVRLGWRFLRRGVLDQSSWQLRLGLALFGLAVLRSLWARKEDVVYSTTLDPGQRLEIRHLPHPS
jgi:hypothetical protein